MQYLRSTLRFGATVSLCFIVGGGAPASASTYLLTDTSQFKEGCFELCACPQWWSDVEGSFQLVPSGADGSFEIFDVRAVEWTVLAPGIEVSGSGTYRVDRIARVQRLELDLRRGLGEVEHFDSGLVAADVDFPAVHVEIAVHGPPACFDTRFELHALPPIAVSSGAWSTIKAMYKQK